MGTLTVPVVRVELDVSALAAVAGPTASAPTTMSNESRRIRMMRSFRTAGGAAPSGGGSAGWFAVHSAPRSLLPGCGGGVAGARSGCDGEAGIVGLRRGRTDDRRVIRCAR